MSRAQRCKLHQRQTVTIDESSRPKEAWSRVASLFVLPAGQEVLIDANSEAAPFRQCVYGVPGLEWMRGTPRCHPPRVASPSCPYGSETGRRNRHARAPSPPMLVRRLHLDPQHPRFEVLPRARWTVHIIYGTLGKAMRNEASGA